MFFKHRRTGEIQLIVPVPPQITAGGARRNLRGDPQFERFQHFSDISIFDDFQFLDNHFADSGIYHEVKVLFEPKPECRNCKPFFHFFFLTIWAVLLIPMVSDRGKKEGILQQC